MDTVGRGAWCGDIRVVPSTPPRHHLLDSSVESHWPPTQYVPNLPKSALP